MSNEQPAGAPQSPQPQGYPTPQPYPEQAYPQQAYPAQPYGTQPYGTQPYGTQAYPGQTYPGQPAQPGQAAQGPYAGSAYPQQFAPQYPAQQQYAGQQYPQQYPQPYPAQPYAPVAQTAGRSRGGSPLLGMIAFGVLALTTIVTGVALAQVMDAVAALMISAGTTSIDQDVLTQMLQDQLVTTYPLQTAVLNIAMPVGFAAWVVGIVATAMNRGRAWGIATIVFGVIAPFILLVVAMMGLGPAFAAIP